MWDGKRKNVVSNRHGGKGISHQCSQSRYHRYNDGAANTHDQC